MPMILWWAQPDFVSWKGILRLSQFVPIYDWRIMKNKSMVIGRMIVLVSVLASPASAWGELTHNAQ